MLASSHWPQGAVEGKFDANDAGAFCLRACGSYFCRDAGGEKRFWAIGRSGAEQGLGLLVAGCPLSSRGRVGSSQTASIGLTQFKSRQGSLSKPRSASGLAVLMDAKLRTWVAVAVAIDAVKSRLAEAMARAQFHAERIQPAAGE